MPHVPIPDERVLVDKHTRPIRGRDCEVYVYEETYSSFFGRKEWSARQVRVEVPYRYESNVERVHDTRGRHGPTDLPPRSDHITEATNQAADWIDKRERIRRDGVTN